MFGLSGSEAAFWLLLAVIVIGPTNLPKAARALRDVLSSVRRTLDQLRTGVDRGVSQSLRASGLQDLDLRGGLDQYLGAGDTEFVPVPPPPAPEPEDETSGEAPAPETPPARSDHRADTPSSS